jgi:hypothetical protein
MHWIVAVGVGLLAGDVLAQSPSFSSTLLDVPTNTGIQQVKFKNVVCGERGTWQFDLVNNAISETRIEWVFWLEDEEGDSIESDRAAASLEPKSRITGSLSFSCDVSFTALRHQFQIVPLGIDRR